jgi:hypothetical protein
MTLSIVTFFCRNTSRAIGLAAGLAIILAYASIHSAQAQNLIDPSTSIGSVPGYAGTGLSGTYYNTGVSDQPLATFTTTNVCFPDCSSTSFSDGAGGLLAFTNGNISNVAFNPNVQAPDYWNNSSLDISGYIAINQPGIYNFTLGSDDNSYLTIGGQNLLSIPGCCTTVGGSASFSAAGLYPILIQFMEYGGGSYLNVTASNDSGCLIGCSDGNGGYIDSGLFYSDAQLQGAPAPAVGSGWVSIALLFLLSAGAFVRLLRHGVAI